MHENIRILRKVNGLSQKKIAEILHVSPSTYSNYETGKKEIPIHIVIQLADYYHTSTDCILGRTEIRIPHGYEG